MNSTSIYEIKEIKEIILGYKKECEWDLEIIKRGNSNWNYISRDILNCCDDFLELHQNDINWEIFFNASSIYYDYNEPYYIKKWRVIKNVNSHQYNMEERIIKLLISSGIYGCIKEYHVSEYDAYIELENGEVISFEYKYENYRGEDDSRYFDSSSYDIFKIHHLSNSYMTTYKSRENFKNILNKLDDRFVEIDFDDIKNNVIITFHTE